MVSLHNNEGIREPCTVAMSSVETLCMNVELVAACVRLFVVVLLCLPHTRWYAVAVAVICHRLNR